VNLNRANTICLATSNMPVRTSRQTLIKEIISNLQAATNNCLELIEAVMSSEHELSRKDCHCLKSLDLAVWTDQGRIKADAALVKGG